ncbi:putative ribonuclease H-like domain-containing protein [Tanacetum coccineum]
MNIFISKSPLKVDKAWKEKIFSATNHVRIEESKKVKENIDAPIIEDWVSDDEEEVEPIPKVEKKTAIPTATKKEVVKPEKPVRRSVRYAEMYRSQRPCRNQRSWNGQKSNQLGYNFVFNNKACFICGSFDHIQYSCPNAHKHMVPRAVLMKTGLKTVNSARTVNTVRSVNTARPFSTARSFNTDKPSYTSHPKSTVHCARPRTHFQNQAQSTIQRPLYKRTTLTKRSQNQNVITGIQTVNTGRQNVNTVRARGFNAVKPSACWVWKPIKPNGASLVFNKYNYIDARGRSNGCSRHMSGNIAHLSDFKDFDGGYVTFDGGANGGRITGKGTIKTDKLDFDDVYFVKELKFNLFSVSQMCDKKNYDNMYSFDMKNIVPKDGLTCLVAKATSEESMLWHRRLGHINFKNINKLVKENLDFSANGVAERKNRTLIEAARTMLADSKLLQTVRARKQFYCLLVKNRIIWQVDGKSDEENKPMIEGNGPKWLFDLDSLTQSMNYVPVVAETFSNDFAGIQGVSESSTSSQQDQENQDCIVMPIWKDASYFGAATPRSVVDAQIQNKDGLHDKNDAAEMSHNDSSLKDNSTTVQQVNTARPKINTSSIEVSTAVPEVNTATPEDLVGPSHASEDTQVEDQEIELGNIPPSYAVPTTPHTRIHKDHLIEHVIGEVHSSVQTRRMTTFLRESGIS